MSRDADGLQRLIDKIATIRSLMKQVSDEIEAISRRIHCQISEDEIDALPDDDAGRGASVRSENNSVDSAASYCNRAEGRGRSEGLGVSPADDLSDTPAAVNLMLCASDQGLESPVTPEWPASPRRDRASAMDADSPVLWHPLAPGCPGLTSRSGGLFTTMPMDMVGPVVRSKLVGSFAFGIAFHRVGVRSTPHVHAGMERMFLAHFSKARFTHMVGLHVSSGRVGSARDEARRHLVRLSARFGSDPKYRSVLGSSAAVSPPGSALVACVVFIALRPSAPTHNA